MSAVAAVPRVTAAASVRRRQPRTPKPSPLPRGLRAQRSPSCWILACCSRSHNRPPYGMTNLSIFRPSAPMCHAPLHTAKGAAHRLVLLDLFLQRERGRQRLAPGSQRFPFCPPLLAARPATNHMCSLPLLPRSCGQHHGKDQVSAAGSCPVRPAACRQAGISPATGLDRVRPAAAPRSCSALMHACPRRPGRHPLPLGPMIV